MAQFSMEIMRLTGSVLRGNQQTFVTEQKMHFEFFVLVGTGGTMSFVHPLSDQAAGAGANFGLLEKLDIVITRNAKD